MRVLFLNHAALVVHTHRLLVESDNDLSLTNHVSALLTEYIQSQHIILFSGVGIKDRHVTSLHHRFFSTGTYVV